MKTKRKRTLLTLIFLGLSLSAMWGATITISIVRTTMPEAEWNRLAGAYTQYETLFATYAGGEDYRIEVKGERINFITDYPDGWDYDYYYLWKDQYISALNQAVSMGVDPGFKWEVNATGELNDATNPWNTVSWMPEVSVVDDDYLQSKSLGWFWADNWDPAGGFWAYAFNLALSWVYVYGQGYYYDPMDGVWYWNWPGTGWFAEVGQSQSGSPTWILMTADPLPTVAALDDIIKDEMIKQNLPGVAVGVFDNNQLVHVNGYGMRDIETGDPVTTSTIFRWASISKPLTAVATLQLDEEDDDFSVEDAVIEHATYWIQPLFPLANMITVEHLLSNRSGIHHYGNGRDGPDADDDPDNTYSWDDSNYDNPDNTGYDGDEAVEVFINTGIDFQPGTQYLYTTFGFNLLGAVVDEASPDGYVEWVEDNIADPLNMSSLQVANSSRLGYDRDCDGRLDANVIGDQEWKLPGGGWESNIVDLTRFAIGISEETLLDDTTRLWTNVAGNANYRWGVSASGTGNNLRIWHGGAHGNLRTLMFVRPNLDQGIAIMAYAEWANLWRLIYRIEKQQYNIDWSNFTTEPRDRCDDDMDSCSGLFAGIWRATGDEVIVRRGYSNNAFFLMWEQMRECGYYCDDFEAHIKDGELRWDGIFRKGTGRNAIWRNFDSDGFNQKWQEMSNDGLRLVDLETYVVNGERRWAGLFRPGSGGYAMWRGFTTSGFADKREEMLQQGLKLIDIEVYVVDNELRWAGVWVQGSPNLLNRNYGTGEFGDLVKGARNNGWKLLDIEAYRVNGELLWAGIWEQSSLADNIWRNWDYCDFMDKHADAHDAGMELLDMEHYDY